jgi:thiamine biosynthesis protein ThiI
MDTAAEPLFLLKIGEIYLKGDNRPRFEQMLVDSLRRAVEPHGAVVKNYHGKLAVHGAGHAPAVLDALMKVFGIVNIEVAFGVQTDMDALVAQSVVLAREAVNGSGGRIRTFRIDARRSFKQFPANSIEINREAGAAVVEATGLRVDLGNPDLWVRIEVGKPHCYVYTHRIPAAGGLPAGCSGRAVLLLSGGIDSPVAGWYAMKRGLAIQAVHFHSPPHTGPAALRKVRDLARILAAWQGNVRLHVVGFTRAQEAVRDAVREDYRILIYRRIMMRVANRIASQEKATALVTGESLGQVASQTLENLGCVEDVSGNPVIRPLVTFDKSEVVERARKLGTYEISIRKGEDCCSLFVPAHPATKGRLGICRAEEDKIDVDALVDDCVETAGTETIGAD